MGWYVRRVDSEGYYILRSDAEASVNSTDVIHNFDLSCDPLVIDRRVVCEDRRQLKPS